MIITETLSPLFSRLKKINTAIIDLLLPPRCPVTGELVGQQGTLNPSYWSTLNFIQSPMCRTCGVPFPHDVGNEMVCGFCLQDPPPFTMARSVWRYDDASAAMILKFKHSDALHLAPILGGFLSRAGNEVIQDADLVIPVPLHRRRLLKRRYNQAGLLANIIAKQNDLKMIPHLLRRNRATESQGHKNAAERKNNIRNAFHILPRDAQLIAGKIILLVDDVYTSGATVKECAQTLLKHGAAQVNVLCLAKVVKD